MSTPPETIAIDTDEIFCDGNGERLRGTQSEPINTNNDMGHPRVYLTVNKNGFVDCPDCGRHFVLKPGARKVAAH